MASHKFQILEEINEENNYTYNIINKETAIEIDDSLILSMLNYLNNLKTYHNKYNNQQLGLAYHGITLIPPSSLMLLYDIVIATNLFRKSSDLSKLASLIMTAKIKNKYILHFGV